jgi:hypothetical protein
MIDTGELHPEPQPIPDYPGLIDQFVRQNYVRRAVWLTDHVNGEAGYLTFLELRPADSVDSSPGAIIR